MIKINALVEEMNYRIAENRAAFREELAKLKLDMAVANAYQTPMAISRNTQRNFSIPTLPKNMHKILAKNHDS
jgi:hypothetical protein